VPLAWSFSSSKMKRITVKNTYWLDKKYKNRTILFKPITQYHFDRKVIGIDGIE
jgi:hypothetical protein